jgi:hypothetical protein
VNDVMSVWLSVLARWSFVQRKRPSRQGRVAGDAYWTSHETTNGWPVRERTSIHSESLPASSLHPPSVASHALQDNSQTESLSRGNLWSGIQLFTKGSQFIKAT